ncbi:hypothetical protein NP493_756g02026 [Ridgeia piscesae]|uniref:Protein FAM184A/B N-terminal domain-containing protein n=1 Tax=Ridgeia piscesae TaxID=27915 RepID=A0AAD9KQZ5_RIDPI|nr:hypothetical protein NP493_756g02026 [Ridgeia piscesae]
MATSTKASFNFHQNGKYATLPQAGKDMEITQDMHLKMSKKIAQLTKVIYALNTKNDEHESIVAGLKEHHEDQQQQLMAEMKHKIEFYREQISKDAGYAAQIRALQEHIQSQTDEQKKALDEFALYRQQAEEREAILKADFSQKTLTFSQQVLKMKKDFEEKLQMIDSLRSEYDLDKANALESLRAEHRHELEQVHLSQVEQASDLSDVKRHLEEMYERDVTQLKQRLEEVEQSKRTLTEEYDAKMAKAKAFYEKELEAMKNSQDSDRQKEMQELEERFKKMKKSLELVEMTSQQRIDALLGQLSASEDEVNKYRSELDELRDSVKNKASETSKSNKELMAVREELSKTLTRLKELEAELTSSQEVCEQQAKDLLNKSTEIAELRATKLQHEAVIKDLKREIERLRERVNTLEQAKEMTESETFSKFEQQTDQLKSLKQAMEKLTAEKNTMKETYEAQLRTLDEESRTTVHKLNNQHRREIETIEQSQREHNSSEQTKAETRFMQMKQELEAQLESERSRLEKEKEDLAMEYGQVKADLSGRLKTAEEEVSRLERQAREREEGVISGLKEDADKLKSDLEQARTQLKATKAKLSSVEADYEKLQQQLAANVKKAAAELKTKLDDQATDLDQKWTEKLRNEIEKLRHALMEQADSDRKKALARLSSVKDDEIAAAAVGWEKKITDLLEQIAVLRSGISTQETETADKLERMKREAQEENVKLSRELKDAISAHQEKIAELETKYEQQLREMNRMKDREIKEKEERLREIHMEDMSGQSLAHRAAMDVVRSEAEKSRHAALAAQADQSRQQMELQKVDLQHRHAMELQQMTQSHQQQLDAARMELDRAIELTKQKDVEYGIKLSELEEEIHHREIAVQSMDIEIVRLQKGITEMSHELDAKGKEILKVRSEANIAVRDREEQLLASHQMALQVLKDKHTREVEGMLVEFAEAQELLKEKISSLKDLLEATEERHRNRPSRPEDLEMIERLQFTIQDRELAVNKLIEEKRYFQRELVNRETNFNKVFNASPQVGILNPLAVKQKGRSTKAPVKLTSSPSLNSRLDPIPGSPIHDDKFNQIRPLPPPSKKFVR